MAETAIDWLVRQDTRPAPRSDARRNLTRLITAAREAVDEIGLDVTAHEIARRAGVGIGTLYRRVPTREALLEAVAREVVDDIIGAADTALADPDPWHGFSSFAERYVQLRATSCGINEALGGAHTLDLDDQLAAIRTRMRKLVTRAQDAAAMRADVRWKDVPFLLSGTIPAPESIGLTARAGQWRVNLRVLLDGLRA